MTVREMLRFAGAAALIILFPSGPLRAQSCPAPLSSALRLVLVTAKDMSSPTARVQRFVRDRPSAAWRAVGPAEPGLIGYNGMGWSFAFRRFARGNEPIKVDGDKRIPAGVFRIGRSFGHGPSSRPGYLRLKNGVVCVDDAASRAYNTITTRQKVGWKVHGENMWRIPEYRHGLLVDYPTGRKQRGGSCIFIHVRMPGATGTHGCVAMTEGHVLALQDFAAPGAVLAVMPSNALERMASCLPDPASH